MFQNHPFIDSCAKQINYFVPCSLDLKSRLFKIHSDKEISEMDLGETTSKLSEIYLDKFFEVRKLLDSGKLDLSPIDEISVGKWDFSYTRFDRPTVKNNHNLSHYAEWDKVITYDDFPILLEIDLSIGRIGNGKKLKNFYKKLNVNNLEKRTEPLRDYFDVKNIGLLYIISKEAYYDNNLRNDSFVQILKNCGVSVVPFSYDYALFNEIAKEIKK